MATPPIIVPIGIQLLGDLTLGGAFTPKPGSMNGNAVNPSNPVPTNCVAQQRVEKYAQAGAAASETRMVYLAFAAGTIAYLGSGNVVAALGNATVTVDLKKNGASCLTAPTTLNSSAAAFSSTPATISVSNYAAGDVLEIVTVATAGAGTLPSGVYAGVVLNEAPVL